MNPRRLFTALVVAMLGVLVFAVPVAGAAPIVSLEANLTGEQEVPGPGDRNGSGDAHLSVYRAKVCYELFVEDIRRPTAAHIHEGRRGVAGPVVVELNTPRRVADAAYFSRGCESIDRSLSRELKRHPARYYVNVHNNPFPDGAVRGQLHR
jgi:hypothetical protein